MAPLHTMSMNVIVDCNIIAERKNTHTTHMDYLQVSFIARDKDSEEEEEERGGEGGRQTRKGQHAIK